jgi:hypothetical protein
MMEALSTPETSDITRATRRNIPEGAILHSHCHGNLKPYTISILSIILLLISDLDQGPFINKAEGDLVIL